MPDQTKRIIEAEDLYRLQLLSDSQISPDGQHVVFCVQRVNRETEKKYTNLWIVRVADGQVRQLTHGDQVDRHPRWAPEGQTIAFLSNRSNEEQYQIYLLPMAGGEAGALTALQGSFDSLQWSPDGRQILCQFRKKDQEVVEREADPQKKELGIVARQISRVFFKLDGTGYLPQERWHIWTIDVETGVGRQLTDSPTFDELSPRWSSDGRQIAFLSNRSPDPDLDPDAVGVYLMPSSGAATDADLTLLASPPGDKSLLSCSPDGRYLAYIGKETPKGWWKNYGIWIVPMDGSRPAQNVTAKYDIDVGNPTLGDIADRPSVRPRWSPDGRRIYFQVGQHGVTRVHSITRQGEDLRCELDHAGVAGMFSLDSAGKTIASVIGDFEDPGNIWLKDLSGAESRQLTQFNRRLLDTIDLGQVEEIWFKGAANNDLQGWIVKPPGFNSSQQYPAILEIHGGPNLQYGRSFMHEFYYLAARGYVVFFCNPRGGQGYGEAHSQPIENDWGSVDYDDLMAWTDLMVSQPYVDVQRVGVAGGSYGGYMTSWIIGHTDRFAAAVAQRVVSNLVSMWGSSDFNWVFQQIFGDAPPWDNLENMWRQSPMAHIGNATTPTMVIHSEQDMRCDLEQGLQLYVALKTLGVPTELILFPEESHGLSRGGRIDRRVARLEHMARWFDRFLKA
ncbi:MAG: S9 family peptidase [Chloroflexota bacterium]